MSTTPFSFSPAKRKPDTPDKSPTKQAAWRSRTPPEDVTEWECPEADCTGRLIKKHTKHSAFVTCSQNIYRDDTTCQFTASFFRPDAKSPHNCLVCGKDVGGSPSLGAPTDSIEANGKAAWDNIHLIWDCCAGKKAAQKLALCTTASEEQVGEECAAYVDGTDFDDVKDGCPGIIEESDTVIKTWTTKPLHAWCAKRLWNQKVDDFIRSKRQQKQLGTSATEESKAPSADITADLLDF